MVQPTPRAKFRILIAVAFCTILVAIAAIAATIIVSRSEETQKTVRNKAVIAGLLAEQTARSVQAVELTLTELRERLADFGATDREAGPQILRSESVHRLLKERLTRLPQAVAITLAGADGRMMNSSRTWPMPGIDVSDRPHFVHFKNGGTGLHIGAPLVSRMTGEAQILFTTKINGDAKLFQGIVAISINVEHFENLYRSIRTAPDQSVSLALPDGTVLVRYPSGSSGAALAADAAALPQWRHAVALGSGSFRTPAIASQAAQIVMVRPLENCPLVITLALSEESALRDWRRRATAIAAATALAVLCLIVLLRALAKQFNGLAESEASLADGKTQFMKAAEELRAAHGQLDAAINHMSQGLCMFDSHGRMVVCNQRYIEMYGLPADQLKPGISVRDVLEMRKALGSVSGNIDQYIADLLVDLSNGRTSRRISETGDHRIISVSNAPIPGGGWVGTHEDITERKRSEEQISHMARHDALTDLANRVLFREKLDTAVARMRRRDEPFAVFVFDLDLFKSVNDSLGHPVGDELLKAVASRLRRTVRDIDAVARLGGDEFAVLMTAEEDAREEAIVLANRLLKSVCSPYEIDGHQIVIGISIGIALAPQHGVDANQLLKNADLALYRTKSDGRNGYRFFESEMDADARLRRSLEMDLRNALSRSDFMAHNDFVIHYQPVHAVSNGKISGFEALVRWNHPERGLLGPDKFVPIAEENGLIISLGEWIMHRACEDAVRWPAELKLAVNLSPAQFRSSNLIDIVVNTVAETGLSPNRLELEITETVLLQKNAGNIAALHQLKSLGASIVLDDFGTGYSSLSYLRMFPFDKVKIDKSFVSEMTDRADCAAIVCAITGLGRSLRIHTTAEGVETKEQFELLRAAGCTHVQGYLFAAPRPVGELVFDTGRHQEGSAA